MLSILLTILGHTAYGISNTLWKNPRNAIGTLPLIIFRSFCCFLIFFSTYYILSFYNIIPQKYFSNLDLLKTIGICCVNYFGLFFFLKSLKHTAVSNTIGLGKIGLVIGIAVAYFFAGETISTLKFFVCGLIFIGVSLIERASKKNKTKFSKGLLYTLLSRIFWGTVFFFPPFIEKVGALLFCAILEFCVCFMSCILFLMKSRKMNFSLVNNKIKTEMILLVICGTIGTFSLNFAITKMSLIVFAFMGLIEPIIGLIISNIYHKEKLSKFEIIGIGMGIFSAFILGFIK